MDVIQDCSRGNGKTGVNPGNNREMQLIELGHKLSVERNEKRLSLFVKDQSSLCISINYISCSMKVSPDIID